MSKVVKKIVTAVAVVAAIVFTGGTALLATIGKALVTAAISIGVSRLVAKRANTAATAGDIGGARVQLPPATSNKLPIIYGTSFIGGSITDAMLSTDQKTMWYVVALAEVSDNQGGGGGSYTFDTNKCYYDGKQIQFASATDATVTGLITNTTPAQIDTRCNGFLYVYLFTNGRASGINTGGQTADQILSIANGVPAAQAWSISQAMTNCAFAIVKVIYNQDAGTTGAGALMVNITNSINRPGDAILDYMLNDRYGCALPIDSIDTASLTALNAYSDELITYNTASGSPPTAQQNRYRINGPLDTGTNCLDNLQFLVDSCDSWLQYSELTGKWKVVINKLYDGYPTVTGLFAVNSSNLIGGIEVSPIDLNETYNQIEVAYPNTNIKDQTDYYIIDLFTDDPQLLSANEAVNRLNVTLPLVNNAVQARYLAARRIYQSREDLVIAFRLDYSGIQLEAGDVIRVTHEVYGWTNKLFRVNNVAETKDEGGNLYADIQAFEYTDGIYADIVTDYVPEFNTGVEDPNVISQPGTPIVTLFTANNATITGFTVSSTSPANGIVRYMDFNYGNNSNVLQHRLYRTVEQSNSAPYTAGTNVAITINDLASGNYYFSTTARNDRSGTRSNSSSVLNWAGANVTPYDPNSNSGGITGNQIAYYTIINNNIANNTITNQNIQLFTLTPNLFANSMITSTVIDEYAYYLADPSLTPINIVVDVANVGINIDTFTDWPYPKLIQDAYTGNLGIYPYAEGTASTAEGYSANSTGQFTPGQASQFVIENGDYGWYVLEFLPFNGNNVPAGKAIYLEYHNQVLSSSNCVFQLAITGTLSSAANTDLFVNTQLLSTYNLVAGQPLIIDYENYVAAVANSLTGAGIIGRVYSGTPDIILMNGVLRITATNDIT